MQYVLNKNAQLGTEIHKIHTINCKRRPKPENSIDLKECNCPIVAKCKARDYFNHVDGCRYCCKEIHFEDKNNTETKKIG